MTNAITSKPETKKLPKRISEKNTVKTEYHSVTVKSNTEQTAEKNWDKILAPIGTGIVVKHKTFGTGTIVWMDKLKKYIRVKFDAGEKQFIFPDAFINGFLDIDH